MKTCAVISLVLSLAYSVESFVQGRVRSKHDDLILLLSKSLVDSELKEENMASGVAEYRNTATKVLSKFMNKDSMDDDEDPISMIEFDAPKIPPSTSIETLAAALDFELIQKEWFVTGIVNPIYFSDDFEFQDPDVQVKGIEDYGRGVRKIFDQSTSRAEIISTVVNTTASTPERPVITCTWRLSGGVNILFGIPIKPYIIYTDFVVDPETSLILFQEDRFSIPSWDIFLSILFPGLIGKITAPAAAAVEKREVSMPLLTANPSVPTLGGSPMEFLSKLFNR